jgi:hypothetical protein
MIEVLKQMVEALEVDAYVYNGEKSWAAIKAGKQAIAELESQEPVGEVGWAANVPNTIKEVHWKNGSPPIGTKIFTHPPQRTWVGLTEEDRAEILSRKWWDFEDEFDVDGFLRLAEAKLKEKNND